VDVATAAVLHALKSSRLVYTIVVGRLLTAILHREQQLLDSNDEVS
jgi:hypothetical protein